VFRNRSASSQRPACAFARTTASRTRSVRPASSNPVAARAASNSATHALAAETWPARASASARTPSASVRTRAGAEFGGLRRGVGGRH